MSKVMKSKSTVHAPKEPVIQEEDQEDKINPLLETKQEFEK